MHPWYRDRAFTHLPFTLENNEMRFQPPPSFIELLNRLAGEA